MIDEAHYYRGVLGAHVAMIIRRLRRICRDLGADPQFVLCSATLSNATEHAEKMVGLPFVSVERDGSPSGSREFVFWNPTVYSGAEEGRASINMEAAEITARLLKRGIRTMTFVRSRSGVERVCDLTRRLLRGAADGTVHPYRAGYLADYRRDTRTAPSEWRDLGSCDDQRYGVGGGCWWLGCDCDHWISGNRVERLATGRAKWSCSDSSPLSAGSSRPPGRPVLHAGTQMSSSTHRTRVPVSQLPTRASWKDHLKCAAFELPLSQRDFKLFGKDNMVRCTKALEEDGNLLSHPDSTWRLADSKSQPRFRV